MRLVGLVVVCMVSLLLAPLGVEPQQATQNRRVGVVALADAQSGAHILQALQDGLRQQGWVEGHNLKLEIRLAEGRLDRLTGLVDELVRLPVDVIVTGSNVETAAARQRTTTIPIVMLIGADPVGSGFTSSLAKPSSNITGLAFDPTPEIFGKHLELLREISPRTTSVIIIRNPQLPGGAAYWDATKRAAQKLGLTLRSVAVQSAEDIQPGLAAIAAARGDAVMVFGDPVTFGARHQIAEASLKSRSPLISTLREYTEAGGVLSYGVHFPALAHRAAYFVDKVLKGAKPRDLPIEQPTKFELVINLKTAKALGLTIPPSVLGRADQVIE